MTTWHVWGDYVHTIPQQIGAARRADSGSDEAQRTAIASGFDFERRCQNGFEPWAAVFMGGDGEAQAFAFASAGTVRGWKPVT